MPQRNRNIMHVELTPKMRTKLDAIVAELRDDPRLEGVDISRQTALRQAVTAYALKGKAAGSGAGG